MADESGLIRIRRYIVWDAEKASLNKLLLLTITLQQNLHNFKVLPSQKKALGFHNEWCYFHKFVRLPFSYCWRQTIEKYGGGHIYDGMMFILSFEKIGQLLSIITLWVVTPCRLVGKYQRFGGIYRLHLQGRQRRWHAPPKRWQHFYPEDGGDSFIRSVGNHLQDYTASQPRRPQ
jgi:hypothetical protein